jgi:hypothetical protein
VGWHCLVTWRPDRTKRQKKENSFLSLLPLDADYLPFGFYDLTQQLFKFSDLQPQTDNTISCVCCKAFGFGLSYVVDIPGSPT